MQGYVMHRLSCKTFLVISVAFNSSCHVVLSFMFILVCIFIATLRKRVSWQYMHVCTYKYVCLCSPLGAFGAV